MTMPTKLMQEDVENALDNIEVDFPKTTAKLRAHISAMESENRALLADNAALASILRAYYEAERTLEQPEGKTQGEWQQALERVEEALRMERPGAALLSEMEGLKRERDEARAHADALALRVGRQETLAEARRITISTMEEEVATARAAALAEAYAAVRNNESRNHPLFHALEAIRALATTPPPPVVPVAKVRLDEDAIVAAALRLGMGKVTRGQLLDFARVLASDLGLTLDGET